MLIYPIEDHSAATGFGGNQLDRVSERREDTAFIDGLRASANVRALLFHDDRLVLAAPSNGAGSGALHSRDTVDALGGDWDNAVFLGLAGSQPWFAIALEEEPDQAVYTMEPLRPLAISGILPATLLGAVAQARGILGWHARHRFCANCGAPTTIGQAGMRRDCATCNAHHFPRTDPVVIMLAVDGERCLLGRQTRFVEGMYSCLAGFMEPGETIEAAVRREIWEEAGIVTSRVAYHSSQPWPFPSSLMLGCFAEATSTEIDPRDAELEDVRWVDRSDIAAMLARTHPTLAAPPEIAIANQLLSAYAKYGAPVLAGSPERAAAERAS